MELEISEYMNLDQRFIDLNYLKPSNICFLPENIAEASSIEKFIYTDNTVTARKLFKINNIPEDRLDNIKPKYRQRRTADWIAPSIFISYSLLSQNPDIISLGINVLSTYITDIFKGSFSDKKVKVEIIVETSNNKTYKKINYEGNADGLKDLAKTIKSLK